MIYYSNEVVIKYAENYYTFMSNTDDYLFLIFYAKFLPSVQFSPGFGRVVVADASAHLIQRANISN